MEGQVVDQGAVVVRSRVLDCVEATLQNRSLLQRGVTVSDLPNLVAKIPDRHTVQVSFQHLLRPCNYGSCHPSIVALGSSMQGIQTGVAQQAWLLVGAVALLPLQGSDLEPAVECSTESTLVGVSQ